MKTLKMLKEVNVMSLNLNKVLIAGRLTDSPELRYTPSGKAVSNFVVATNEYWNDGNGEKQQKTEFHQITCWNSLAENCVRYLVKGQAVYIEGSLRTRKYEDQEGVQRTVTFCLAQLVKFLDKPFAKAQDEPKAKENEDTPDDEQAPEPSEEEPELVGEDVLL
jgi:single-strand DNA-binding protein